MKTNHWKNNVMIYKRKENNEKRREKIQPVWSTASLSLNDSIDVDSWNDEVVPKKFKSAVSTATMTTVEPEDTEYRYSQDSMHEEEDHEIDEEEAESIDVARRYGIIEHSCLMRLFQRCEECGARLDRSLIETRTEGSALIVNYDCLECKASIKWEGQEKVGRGKSQVYSANHFIPIASFITGMRPARLHDWANLLGMDMSSERQMRKVVSEIGSVAIERVHEEMQEIVREVAVNASAGKGLQVSIDGQFDCPGFTSTNNKDTVIDCHTKLALAGVAMHKNMPGIDGISIRMESEGVKRALVELIDAGIEITTRVGDQNAMVNKKLREEPKTAHIEVLNDWWHVQRPIRKEWWKLVKANPALASIYQKFFNHLYCVHNKYPLLKDRKRALEVVRSFVMHIQGKHKWKKGDGFEIVTKCEHGRLKKLKKGEKREILANSDELELIRTLVFAPKFEKAFLTAASLIDTSINECYHSLSLISPPYYKLKMLVSMLHYNGLMLDDLLGQRAEIGNTVLKRKGRLVGAIKRKRGAGTHVWRARILAESLKVREELSEAREIARLGIPEDDVFDELVNWWDMKE
ncbi:hypothetical protein PMAYCL1PPCAC_05881, partial [Pristionchus mayeri]